MICYYFVSGSFDAQRTNFWGVFDYGFGECDNQATFTCNNGTEISITLIVYCGLILVDWI